MNRVLALLVCCALAAPALADKKKASEHFALAEAAERRKDWRAAIEEYELSYAAEPHAAMLYNIARNHERLGEARDAAEYYRRYLDEEPNADDRTKVEGRIQALRARRAKVAVVANPAGAAVFIDGERVGEAPVEQILEAGPHEVYVAHQGRTSDVKELTVEFGEPQTARFDLVQSAGYLEVGSNVDGAEVRLDGDLIGRTPFRGQVPAGKHQIVVARPGFQSGQREVQIHPSGSERIRVDLERIDGGTEEPTPPAPMRYLFGISYGYDGVDQATRFTLDLGIRSGGERAELTVLFGLLGPELSGVGLAGRYYFAREARLRPYARVAALMLKDNSIADTGRMIGIEGGAGVLIPMQTRAYRIDYYLELDLQSIVAGLPEDPMDGSDTKGRFSVPVSFGVIWSWGPGAGTRR